MSAHVVVGSGPVGSALARLLADRGEEVRVVTRRGTGPEHEAVERITADAAEPGVLPRIAEGATALYNCAGMPYPRWAAAWPPLSAAFLSAAEASGALLVSTSNLYAYGPADGPMTERTPPSPQGVKARVRARMWDDALAAHEVGRIRTAEVRSSDYLGAGTQSLLTEAVLPRVLAGRRASVPADLDAPHSWTYAGDVARTLAAVAADDHAWGRVWHTPTAPPRSLRDLATEACAMAGAPAPRLSAMPRPALWLGGLFNPMAREFRETAYQFSRPFTLDSSAATERFGLRPTPVSEALQETVEHLRAAARA